jgi:hypothetical protein
LLGPVSTTTVGAVTVDELQANRLGLVLPVDTEILGRLDRVWLGAGWGLTVLRLVKAAVGRIRVA